MYPDRLKKRRFIGVLCRGIARGIVWVRKFGWHAIRPPTIFHLRCTRVLISTSRGLRSAVVALVGSSWGSSVVAVDVVAADAAAWE